MAQALSPETAMIKIAFEKRGNERMTSSKMFCRNAPGAAMTLAFLPFSDKTAPNCSLRHQVLSQRRYLNCQFVSDHLGEKVGAIAAEMSVVKSHVYPAHRCRRSLGPFEG